MLIGDLLDIWALNFQRSWLNPMLNIDKPI
jgi:hypothetical protein